MAGLTSLSLLTWNILFSPNCWAERMAGVLRTCEAKRPSVVCLQEVLPQFLLQPGWDAWLERHGYVSSAADPRALEPYGVMTLALRELHPSKEDERTQVIAAVDGLSTPPASVHPSSQRHEINRIRGGPPAHAHGAQAAPHPSRCVRPHARRVNQHYARMTPNPTYLCIRSG